MSSSSALHFPCGESVWMDSRNTILHAMSVVEFPPWTSMRQKGNLSPLRTIRLHECSTHEICGKFIQYIFVHAVLMVMAVV